MTDPTDKAGGMVPRRVRDTLFAAGAAALGLLAGPARGQQIAIARVEKMPNRPRPYAMRNWTKVARDYDAIVSDFRRKGRHLPLIWSDESKHNYPFPGFGMPSYVGSAYRAGGSRHEAINCMAAVVGATLVGIDKSRQNGRNFALMCQKYFNRDNGMRLYLNGTRHGTGGSFWYETYPAVLFAQLRWLHPKTGEMDRQMVVVADRMREAILTLRDETGVPDFDHTAFDYRTMRAADNGRHREPDAAAGYAWFEYMAYVATGNAKYLEAADLCMQFLQRRTDNPFYEVLLPFAACLAARMNAELGRRYDVRKLVRWVFGPSRARPGWGILVDRWRGMDVSGLCGSTTDGGGYAFAMNTFAAAAALVPIARYDPRYARAIGKYLLNCANAARLLYANAHPPDRQTSFEWARRHDPASCIAYEGLRKTPRRHVTAGAAQRSIAGEVLAGAVAHTRIAAEAAGRRCQVLRERVVGDHDRLEHVWTIDLPRHRGAWLAVEARCDEGGDGDRGFRFSVATGERGAYRPLFVVGEADRFRSYGAGLPARFHGRLYVKVEDTDRATGQGKPDTLHLDALYVIYEFDGGPYAMGDRLGGRPADVATDLGLYGSSHVGYLGGIVRRTDVAAILRLDLLKTDWYHGKAYPTWLYYNPHEEARSVSLDVGDRPRDLYDAVAGRFVGRGVRGRTSVAVAPDSAAVIVSCPAGGRVSRAKGRTLVGGVVVDYRRGGG